jgi:hypothetical protein
MPKPFRQVGWFLILYGNAKCPGYVWQTIVTNVQILDFPKENSDLRCKYLVCRPKTGISDWNTRYFTKHQITRKVLGISFGNRNFRSYCTIFCFKLKFSFSAMYDLRFWFQLQLVIIGKIRLIQSKEGDVNDELYSRMQITWHVK